MSLVKFKKEEEKSSATKNRLIQSRVALPLYKHLTYVTRNAKLIFWSGFRNCYLIIQ